MKYCSVKMLIIALTVALSLQCCWCLPAGGRAAGGRAAGGRAAGRRAQQALPQVTCFSRGIRAVFGPLVQSNLNVTDVSGATAPVPQDEGPCGVKWSRENDGDSLSFFSRYNSCYVQTEGSSAVVPLVVQLVGDGRRYKVNVSCPLITRRRERPRATPTPVPTGRCEVERALQVPCGPPGRPLHACTELGCCYDPQHAVCFYRLNACSMDGHFVFSVRTTEAEPWLDPSSLGVRGHAECLPVITTADAAVFKISVAECGTKMKLHAGVLSYEVELEPLETKHSPFSLQVQCDFKASSVPPAAVRSRNLITTPAPVVAMGTIPVEMKIATDASFTSFVAEEDLPVTLPLRSPVFVEVSVVDRGHDPSLSLRVWDCFAYPASRSAVWTLLYDGCPSADDSMRSSLPVDSLGRTASRSQVRRFDVKTFAFLDRRTGQPSTEEIYFYCWVEVCPANVDCAQPCTIISSEDRRRRREAPPPSSQAELVSLGPVTWAHNATGPNAACVDQNTMIEVTLYALGAVGAALLVTVALGVGSCVRRRRLRGGRDLHAPESPPRPAH